MKAYTDMTKKELLECIEMASEDAHAEAKRWNKPVLIEWLEGFAEQTDVAPSVAEEPEPEPVEAETQQTDQVETADDDRTLFEYNGSQYQRKIKTHARSGRRWAWAPTAAA